MTNPAIPELTVTCTGLGKRFGRQWIMRDFEDDFVSGEVIGVKGRNGSGKSTLLRMLCGQLTPSRGKVSWVLGGQDSPVGDWYQFVSWTGPYTEVIEELSVEEMLQFHFGLKPLRNDFTVRTVLETIGLYAARKRSLLDCSSGMRQRVLLATALYAATPLLVLDEPTVTLDAEARRWFQEQLAVARKGRLTIIASNDDEDLRQCTRIVSLNSAN